MVKAILVGLGDVPYTASATQYALDLAVQNQARLTAVTLLDPDRLSPGPVPVGAGEAARQLYEYRLRLSQEVIEKSVEHFERECRNAGCEYRVVREEGQPLERLVSAARYHDLMICGLKNLFDYGVVDEPPYELIKLVENGVRPVIAVPPNHREIRRVLMAYSGSAESAKAMRRFVGMHLWPDAQYHIVTFDSDAQAAQERLQDVQWYCEAHGFAAEISHRQDNPKHGVLELASEVDADLIVMGNSAKRLWMRRIFGETVLHVVAHADRPLYLY